MVGVTFLSFFGHECRVALFYLIGPWLLISSD